MTNSGYHASAAKFQVMRHKVASRGPHSQRVAMVLTDVCMQKSLMAKNGFLVVWGILKSTF